MVDVQQQITPYWKVILAAGLDFLTAFFALGMLISILTGQLTENGFILRGWSALLFFGLLVAYFVLGSWLGGTIWRRILGVRPLPR